MVVVDDRTEEQKKTHTWLIVGTDKFLSGWGGAAGGKSVAAWACIPADSDRVLRWAQSRSDMKRVREVSLLHTPHYRPGGNVKHFHIYDVDAEHPALR